MSSAAWRLIAENRIAEAFERGEFDNLPGKGRPLDLSEYFATPVEDRLAFSVLKSAGVVPPEVERLREVQRLEAALAQTRDPVRQRMLREQIQAARVQYALRAERRLRAARGGGAADPGVV